MQLWALRMIDRPYPDDEASLRELLAALNGTIRACKDWEQLYSYKGELLDLQFDRDREVDRDSIVLALGWRWRDRTIDLLGLPDWDLIAPYIHDKILEEVHTALRFSDSAFESLRTIDSGAFGSELTYRQRVRERTRDYVELLVTAFRALRFNLTSVRGDILGSLEIPAPDSDDIPSWDSDAGELHFRGQLCRKVKGGPNVCRKILDIFQERGWSKVVDLPLDWSDDDVRRATYQLNQGLGSPLRFDTTNTRDDAGKLIPRMRWRTASSAQL